MRGRLDQLLRSLMVSTRATALVLVAVLAGAVGGAWAVAGAPGLDRVTVTTVADETDSPDADETAEPEKTKPPKDHSGKPGKAAQSGKPAKGNAAKTGAQGVHGKCVSAVARSNRTGGPNDNHGFVVSKAAETCPHPTPSATG